MKLYRKLRSVLFSPLRRFISVVYRPNIIRIEDGGSNNKVILAGKVNGLSLKVIFRGSNNLVEIGSDCWFHDHYNKVFIAGDNNRVSIGDKTTFDKNVLLVACEGTSISIGEDCMFAADVTIRTSDQHPIYNNRGERLNFAKDIEIGDHVWLGAKTVIMKGVHIGSGSMVGFGSYVTKSLSSDSLAVGCPARVIKENIHWERTFKRYDGK